MPPSADDRQISLEEVINAAATHELGALVERLVRERSWFSIGVLFAYAAGPRSPATLDDIRAAAEMLRTTLEAIPAPRRAGAALADQLRSARIAAGEALLARTSHPPVAELERLSLRAAAGLLFDAGDHRRAAAAYEELDDHGRAAEAYGAMGDLDRMEASHAREEARARTLREALDAMRGFEALLAAGERVAAIAAAARIPAEVAAAAAIHQQARQVESRLIRQRAVTLRSTGAAAPTAFRFASVPAALGRDLLAEVPIRDPGVSRRHATIALAGGELVLEDTGSRSGVRVAGAALGAPLPLRGEGELSLGRDCRLHFRAVAPGRVLLRGLAGLDRQLVALVGIDPLPLGELLPDGGAGAWLELSGGVPRLCRTAETWLRAGGQYVGPTCELLHGEVIEIGAATPGRRAALLRLEVE